MVDSKAPLAAYLAALEAPDEATRAARLADHSRQIRQHIDALGSKSYWAQLTCTPEFVVLFLPGEVFFRAAMDSDAELIEYGVSRKVIVASPTTLIALLKAVAYGWNQKNLAESARKISEAGRDLYKRLCTMTGYMQEMGKKLGGAVTAYNEMLRSMESRVFPVGTKISRPGSFAGGGSLAGTRSTGQDALPTSIAGLARGRRRRIGSAAHEQRGRRPRKGVNIRHSGCHPERCGTATESTGLFFLLARSCSCKRSTS